MFSGCNLRRSGSVSGMLSLFMLLFSSITFTFGAQASAGASKIKFNIPSENVRSALIELADRTDLSLIYDIEELGQLKTNAVTGLYTPLEALAIMLNDTGLTFELTGEETVAISKNKLHSDKQEKDGMK